MAITQGWVAQLAEYCADRRHGTALGTKAVVYAPGLVLPPRTCAPAAEPEVAAEPRPSAASAAAAVLHSATDHVCARHSHAHAHSHDDQPPLHELFGSVAVERQAELDELAFTDWLLALLQAHGGSLYRAKGLVWFAGEAAVVQCVRTHVDIARWEGAEPPDRASRLVFIGRNLDSEDIRRSFEACVAAAP